MCPLVMFYSPCCCSSNWQKNDLKNFVLLFSFAHFSKKKIKFLLFGRIFLFFFLFSSIQEKHFCEQTPVLLVFIALYLSLWKNSSVFLKWISFDFFFLTSFFRPFFLTSCFCSSRFAFTSFFISFSVWPFIFLISFFLNSVFWTAISLLKKIFNLSFFYTHAFFLYVLLLIHLFICCLFFSLRFFSFLIHLFPFPFVFSVHNLSERQVYGTVAKQKKLVCLFTFLVGTFFIFICLCMFVCFFRFFPFFLSPFTYSPCSQEC